MLVAVRLEVIRKLVLAREAVRARREFRARKAVEASRREQSQRIPAVPPLVADLVASLQHDMAHPAPRQLVRAREPGLTGSDHHCIVPLHIAHSLLTPFSNHAITAVLLQSLRCYCSGRHA